MNPARFALLAALIASPASAEPIASKEAPWHIGETETVKGRASVTFMPSGEIYIDLDGRGDGAPISAYISRWNRARFPDISSLDGRTIEISGQIGSFRYRPEIFLQSPEQIAAK